MEALILKKKKSYIHIMLDDDEGYEKKLSP